MSKQENIFVVGLVFNSEHDFEKGAKVIKSVSFSVEELLVETYEKSISSYQVVKTESELANPYSGVRLISKAHELTSANMSNITSWTFVRNSEDIQMAKETLILKAIQEFNQEYLSLQAFVNSLNDNEVRSSIVNEMMSQYGYAINAAIQEDSPEYQGVINTVLMYSKNTEPTHIYSSVQLLYITGESSDGSEYEVVDEAMNYDYLVKDGSLSASNGFESVSFHIKPNEDFIGKCWESIYLLEKHSRQLLLTKQKTILDNIKVVSSAL